MSTHGHDHKHKTHDHSHSGAVLHAPAAPARPTTTPPWRPGPTRKFQCGLRAAFRISHDVAPRTGAAGKPGAGQGALGGPHGLSAASRSWPQ